MLRHAVGLPWKTRPSQFVLAAVRPPLARSARPPGSSLSGQEVADLLPCVVELSVIVLTKHGEELLELVAVLSTELECRQEVIPGFLVDGERVADHRSVATTKGSLRG
jgi:hypothetical protein